MIHEICKSVDGNHIRKLFDRRSEGMSSESIRVGRKEGILITSMTGRQAVISPSKTKQGYGDVALGIVRKDGRDKIVHSVFNDNAQTELNLHRKTWCLDLNSARSNGLLRPAQRGAILATLAHWCTKTDPATIVMPTGTGKTETILATICLEAEPLSLIVVPSDALRSQVFERTLTWGRLYELGAVTEGVEYPSVGVVWKKFKSTGSFDKFLDMTQIVVTTMPFLASMSDENLATLAGRCGLVAVDEAHHLAAKTWSRVIESFQFSKIVQYTATPFRNDGKHIGGDMIFEYPLSKCQKENIFKPINFHPIAEFLDSESDAAIAKMAVSILRKDLKNNLNHALMARVSSKARAHSLVSLYAKLAPEFNPVVLYSGMKAVDAAESKSALLNCRSRIVVCVNMLGEGFDFPPLKIAAIHDPHKSLPVTLQFVGRFTRSGNDEIGEASMVANIALPKVADNIAALYSQDSDWDKLIQNSYDVEVGGIVEFHRFLRGFRFDGIEGFSLRNIHPRFTSTVFRAESEVRLESLLLAFNDGERNRTSINVTDNIAVVVGREDCEVDWGNIRSLVNTVYHCTCLYHDQEHGLLFIFSTSKDLPNVLVDVVCDQIRTFGGRDVLRSLHGINRLMLTNVGLKHRLIGPVRYRSYIGPDVAQGMIERATENSTPVMLFGVGYENAARASIGCSMKGKIWSRNGGTLYDWKKWCQSVGAKLADSSIDVDSLLEGMLYPILVDRLPDDCYPVAVDWSDFFFYKLFDRTIFTFDGHVVDAEDLDFGSVTKSSDNSLLFELGCEDFRLQYHLRLTGSGGGYTIDIESIADCVVSVGREEYTGIEYFSKYPPVIWFHDTSCLVDGCFLIKAKDGNSGGQLSLSAIEARGWNGVDIRSESQGPDRISGTIQYSVAEELRRSSAMLVFDDDGSGEIADLIAIYNQTDKVVIELHHLKFSCENKPGLRVDDVYALCGQAQKAVKWAASIPNFIDHIRNRETKRHESGRGSRFEVGDLGDLPKLTALIRQKPVEWRAILVQPGLDVHRLRGKSQGAISIRRMLGATASYLAETYQMSLLIVANEV